MVVMEGHLVLESVEQWVWVLENKPRLHNCLHFCVLQVWEHQLGVVYLVGVTEISTYTVCLIRLPAISGCGRGCGYGLVLVSWILFQKVGTYVSQ